MMLNLIFDNFTMNYLFVFVLLFLEYANFPIPGTLMLPLIGVLSFECNLNIVLVLFYGTIGGLCGSLVSYYLGYKIGKPFIQYLNKKFKSTQKATKVSYNWINKHNKFAVLFSRLFPVARGFISVVAGVINMKLKYFITYSFIGILLWNIITISLGYFIGDSLGFIIKNIEKGFIVILILIFICYFTKNKKKELYYKGL